MKQQQKKNVPKIHRESQKLVHSRIVLPSLPEELLAINPGGAGRRRGGGCRGVAGGAVGVDPPTPRGHLG